MDFCSGEIHKAIHAVAHLVEKKALAHGYSPRFAASKLIEGDPPLAKELELSKTEMDILGHFIDGMENELKTDHEAAMADMRYSYIEKLVADTVKKPDVTKEQRRSLQIDRILTHRFWPYRHFWQSCF